MLRQIFEPKRDEVTETGEHCSKYLLTLLTKYYQNDKIKKMREAGHIPIVKKRGKVYAEFWWEI